jgi:hypothetical protein
VKGANLISFRNRLRARPEVCIKLARLTVIDYCRFGTGGERGVTPRNELMIGLAMGALRDKPPPPYCLVWPTYLSWLNSVPDEFTAAAATATTAGDEVEEEAVGRPAKPLAGCC